MEQTMGDHNSAKAGTAVQVRLSGALFTDLENWRRQQPKLVVRSVALRELLGQALAHRSSAKRGREARKPS
jgi:hypothetical protein